MNEARLARAYLESVVRNLHSDGAVRLSGFEDVSDVLHDATRFTRAVPRLSASAKSLDVLSSWAVFRDDAPHAALRQLLGSCLAASFSRLVRDALERRIEQLVIGCTARGAAEIRSELANPITWLLASEIYGVPEPRVHRLHEASRTIDTSLSGGSSAAVDEAVELFRSAAAESALHTKLWTAAAAGSDTLDRETIVSNLAMLLYGFFGPLPAALSSIVLMTGLREDYRRAEIEPEAWLREVLRVFSPTAAIDRVATCDVTLRSCSVHRGQSVRCVVALANRDATVFIDPNTFDCRRRNLRHHLGFGAGPHLCLAKMIVEATGTMLLRHLCRHTQQVRLISPVIEWDTSMNAVGPVSAMVQFVGETVGGK